MAMELLLSQATLQNAHIRKLLCGAPSVVIRDGAPVQSALKKNRLSIDEMLEVLRGNGITDIAEVRYAILETDGIVNVIPWADQRPVTVGRLGLQAEDNGLFTIFINDGRIMSDNLTLRGLDNTWLENEIKRNGADTAKDVFLLSADEALNVRFFAKEKR